ncbi:hypothetical protein Tco_0904593 [Tanacetum coccineum]
MVSYNRLMTKDWHKPRAALANSLHPYRTTDTADGVIITAQEYEQRNVNLRSRHTTQVALDLQVVHLNWRMFLPDYTS